MLCVCLAMGDVIDESQANKVRGREKKQSKVRAEG
jgi:hypothetical protein